MWKFLILGLALFVLLKLMKGGKKHKTSSVNGQKADHAASAEMVKDPVCGTYVQPDGDIRVRNGDVIEYFCSYTCRDAYLASLNSSPEKEQDK